MKKVIISFLLAVGLVSLYSCSSNEEPQNTENKGPNNKNELSLYERVSLLNDYEIPKEDVLNILSKFEALILDENQANIKSFETDYQIYDKYYFSDASVGLTKTKSTVNKEDELPVYKILINKGNKKGYALVSGDARHPKVLALIPVSEFSTQEINTEAHLYPETDSPVKEMRTLSLMSALNHVKHFNMLKDSLRLSAKEKLNSESFLKSTVEEPGSLDWYDYYPQYVVERTDKTHKLTKTHWHQGKPFNCKLEQCCPEGPDGRYWVGCGVVAIAQAIAHYEPKMNILAYSMDWPNIKKSPYLVKGVTDKKILNQVGMLMKWILETSKSKSDCSKGTSTDVNAIEQILPLVGMKCDKGKNWDWNSVAASLRVGNIVHVSAFYDETKNSGHGWLMDGFLHIKMKQNEGSEFETIYVHNNFGWSSVLSDDSGFYEIEEPLVFTANGGQNYSNRFRIQTNISKK